jgi:hypothetical protein
VCQRRLPCSVPSFPRSAARRRRGVPGAAPVRRVTLRLEHLEGRAAPGRPSGGVVNVFQATPGSALPGAHVAAGHHGGALGGMHVTPFGSRPGTSTGGSTNRPTVERFLRSPNYWSVCHEAANHSVRVTARAGGTGSGDGRARGGSGCGGRGSAEARGPAEVKGARAGPGPARRAQPGPDRAGDPQAPDGARRVPGVGDL